MSCKTCNAATKIIADEGSTEQGYFVEKYECANGHIGTVEGLAEQSPQRWNRYGAVFNK